MSIAGVVSSSYGCAQPELPAVFTRTPAYRKAIEEVISGTSTEFKGQPEDTTTAVLGDTGENPSQSSGSSGGGSFHAGWWFALIFLRRWYFRSITLLRTYRSE
jgi:secreted trypsin-like serine protease